MTETFDLVAVITNINAVAIFVGIAAIFSGMSVVYKQMAAQTDSFGGKFRALAICVLIGLALCGLLLGAVSIISRTIV